MANFRWTCPGCNVKLDFPNEVARGLADRARACAGCRLRETLMVNTAALAMAAILDFFARRGAPASDSWKASVPDELLGAFGLAEPSDAAIAGLFGVPVRIG